MKIATASFLVCLLTWSGSAAAFNPTVSCWSNFRQNTNECDELGDPESTTPCSEMSSDGACTGHRYKEEIVFQTCDPSGGTAGMKGVTVTMDFCKRLYQCNWIYDELVDDSYCARYEYYHLYQARCTPRVNASPCGGPVGPIDER